MYGLGYLIAMGPLLWRDGKGSSFQSELERLLGKRAEKKFQVWDEQLLQLEWRNEQPESL